MTTKNIQKLNELIIYTGKNGCVELRADTDKETIWASLDQIAELFGTTKQNISQRLKAVFKDEELNQNSVVNDLFTTAKDGKQYKVRFYNLDAIIAVGYRVNSKQATQFRIWATKTLREYLINGFSIDKYKIQKETSRFNDLRDTIDFIESKTHGKVKGKITLKLSKELI